MRCPGSKWLLFFPKLKEFVKEHDDRNVICTANGWLEDQEQQFFYNRMRTLKKPWTKCISVAGEYVENDKIWCAYLVVNYVSLRTFWTPLVYVFTSNNKEQWLTTAVWSDRSWLEHVWPGRHGRLLLVCRRICRESTCWVDRRRPRRRSLCASRFFLVRTSVLSTRVLQAIHVEVKQQSSKMH